MMYKLQLAHFCEQTALKKGMLLAREQVTTNTLSILAVAPIFLLILLTQFCGQFLKILSGLHALPFLCKYFCFFSLGVPQIIGTIVTFRYQNSYFVVICRQKCIQRHFFPFLFLFIIFRFHSGVCKNGNINRRALVPLFYGLGRIMP